MSNDILEFRSAEEMDRWLSQHYAQSKGVWVRFFRKDSGAKSINKAEALELALSYGWITGQAKPCDEISWLNWFGRRRPNIP